MAKKTLKRKAPKTRTRTVVQTRFRTRTAKAKTKTRRVAAPLIDTKKPLSKNNLMTLGGVVGGFVGANEVVARIPGVPAQMKEGVGLIATKTAVGAGSAMFVKGRLGQSVALGAFASAGLDLMLLIMAKAKEAEAKKKAAAGTAGLGNAGAQRQLPSGEPSGFISTAELERMAYMN